MPDKITDDSFRSGYTALVGPPNAGKSTLLNNILGEKISITSKKPQTTRNRILGILHRPLAQIIFIDTPGIHKPRGELNTRIVNTALATLGEVDLILLLIDATAADTSSEQILLSKIAEQKKPTILAINKIDLVKKEHLLTLIDKWSDQHPFKSIIPVSARTGAQVEDLVSEMEGNLPHGPPFFLEDELTDIPERFLAAEMVREKVIRLTGQEIPYASAVTVEAWQEKKNGALIRIDATIHVERSSQKGIIIGKGGSKLRAIGEAARLDIERLLGTSVFLKLFVRVEKNWSRDTKALRKLGY